MKARVDQKLLIQSYLGDVALQKTSKTWSDHDQPYILQVDFN